MKFYNIQRFPTILFYKTIENIRIILYYYITINEISFHNMKPLGVS